MNIQQALFLVIPFLVIGSASAINISGTVRSSSGQSLEGVRVKLGKTDLTATTGPDGIFSIKDATGFTPRSGFMEFGRKSTLQFENNTLLVTLAQQTQVTAKVYNCNGRLLFSYEKIVSSGNCRVPFPQFGSGVLLYRVAVDGEQHTFKMVGTMKPGHVSSSRSTGSVVAKQAKINARIDDALMFIKQGYQYFRCSVTNPDTTGVQVTLSPLDTGTVADVEGNVYRTVRIGNQYWTAENLRTTKYNDGSSIGRACYFYKNTTDAAAIKKWGALYTDAAANSGKLAPAGWRVPTGADWDTLVNYLVSHGYNYDGTTKKDFTAKALAAATDWPESIDSGAIGLDLSLNNASGFSALPAGWKFYDFEKQGTCGYWWIAGGGSANVSALWWILCSLDRHSTINFGASVRLVKRI